MSEELRRSRWVLPTWERATLLAWFAAMAAVASQFPRGGDDWSWGSSEGIVSLRDGFAGLNGRYAGNLAILALTRSGPLAFLVVAAVVCASGLLVLQLAGNRTPLGYAAVATMYLAMPLGMWRQSVAWLSGFANYALGGLFLLLLLALAQHERTLPMRKVRASRLVLPALGGFVGALFMEHVTLCMLGLGLLLAVTERRRTGHLPARTTTWTAAALLGAVVMFSNSAYRNAVAGQGYQTVSTSSPLTRVLDVLPGQAVTQAVLPVLAVVLSVLVLAVAGRRPAVAVLTVLAGVLDLVLVTSGSPLPGLPLATSLLLALVLCLRPMVGTGERTPDRRWVVRGAMVGLVGLTGPLLVVNPLGPRSFYPGYLLLLVLALSLLGEVAEAVPGVQRRLVVLPLGLLAGGLASVLLLVYADISRAVDRDLAQVRRAAAAGLPRVVLAPLPHSDYVHDVNPYWSRLQERYRLYYGIRPTLQIRLSPNPWIGVPGQPPPPPAP